MAFDLTTGIAVVIVGVILVALAVMLGDIVKKRAGSGVILLCGLFILFLGERVFGLGDWRMGVSGLGLVIVVGALGLRMYGLMGSEDARRAAHRNALTWSVVSVGALVLYALTLESATDMLGFDEDAAARWNGALGTIWPIAMLLGLLPTLLIDRTLAVHPVVMPLGATQRAVVSGITMALATALVFPINYLANAHSMEWDVAYFRTTKPGESTMTLVKTPPEPVEATLFFSAANDVGQEVVPYFNALAEASGGQFTFKMVDQALDPVLAEELKVRDNGNIALTQGDNTEKFKLGTELDRAKRDLKKLDSTVQKNLIKLTRGQHVVYLLTGHGEASWREKDNVLRKLNLFKKGILDAQNYKVKNLGVSEGSSDQIPDDASMVLIAAPEKPLLPEEEAALKKYYDDGGRLFVAIDAGGDPLTGLLNHLGVEPGGAPLANEEKFLRQTRGISDRVLLYSNKFGSHESVKTLSRHSTQLAVITPTVVSVEKLEDTENKVTTLIRSFPNTWEDSNNNFEPDDGEPKKVFQLAVAVTPTDDEAESRAIVLGDVSALSDPVLQYSQGNGFFARDAMRWLVGDEDIVGEVSSEEDVKIQHTRDQDQYWYWFTVLAAPVFPLGLGVIFNRRRRRKS